MNRLMFFISRHSYIVGSKRYPKTFWLSDNKCIFGVEGLKWYVRTSLSAVHIFCSFFSRINQLAKKKEKNKKVQVHWKWQHIQSVVRIQCYRTKQGGCIMLKSTSDGCIYSSCGRSLQVLLEHVSLSSKGLEYGQVHVHAPRKICR